DETWLTPHSALDDANSVLEVRHACAALDSLPERLAGAGGRIEGLALLDVARQLGRRRDPLVPREEKRQPQDDAAECVIFPRVGRDMAVLRDPQAHLIERGNAIAFAEGFPGKIDRYDHMAGEHTAAHDVVIRGVEFEQERLAGLQRPERPRAARLPEID